MFRRLALVARHSHQIGRHLYKILFEVWVMGIQRATAQYLTTYRTPLDCTELCSVLRFLFYFTALSGLSGFGCIRVLPCYGTLLLFCRFFCWTFWFSRSKLQDAPLAAWSLERSRFLMYRFSSFAFTRFRWSRFGRMCRRRVLGLVVSIFSPGLVNDIKRNSQRYHGDETVGLNVWQSVLHGGADERRHWPP